MRCEQIMHLEWVLFLSNDELKTFLSNESDCAVCVSLFSDFSPYSELAALEFFPTHLNQLLQLFCLFAFRRALFFLPLLFLHERLTGCATANLVETPLTLAISRIEIICR